MKKTLSFLCITALCLELVIPAFAMEPGYGPLPEDEFFELENSAFSTNKMIFTTISDPVFLYLQAKKENLELVKNITHMSSLGVQIFNCTDTEFGSIFTPLYTGALYISISNNYNTDSVPVIINSLKSNFTEKNIYQDNLFTDVLSTDWFAADVRRVYEYGIMQGQSTNSFGSKQNLSIAETIAMAVRLRDGYLGFSGNNLEASTPWYQAYVDYALSHNIITTPCDNYDIPITRAEFVQIMFNAIPVYAPILNYEIEIIPDVPKEHPCYGAIKTFYQMGILTGNDEYGTFTPDNYIDRASVAAIVARIADPLLRKAYILKNQPEYEALSFVLLTMESFISATKGIEPAYSMFVAKRNAYLEKWKEAQPPHPSDSPIGPFRYTISYNEYDIPQVNLSLYNLTDKEISSFELEFTCLDIYGEPASDAQYSQVFQGYIDRANLNPYSMETYCWTLWDNPRTASIRGTTIVRCAFTDGTIWTSQE